MKAVALMRSAPIAAYEAGSCRVRCGISGRSPAQVGLTDFRGGISVVREQQLPTNVTRGLKTGGWLSRQLGTILTPLATLTNVIYVGGTRCSQMPDGTYRWSEAPVRESARHYNDPAWCLDLLWGVTQGEFLPDGPDSTESGGTPRAAGICDITVAHERSPHGVRQRPGERQRGDLHFRRVEVEWAADRRPARIDMPLGGLLWRTELWDYGVDFALPPGAPTLDEIEQRYAGTSKPK